VQVENSVPLWLSIVGFAAPLIALAGSAVAYVVNIFIESRQRRRNQFFELMDRIDNKNAPIAGKQAAVYQMRQFPEHRDFVVRFCKAHRDNIKSDGGGSAKALADEMDATCEYFERYLK
jgi:hypothetical protein